MKGQLYTLESAIAILMILFIIVFLFQNPPTSPELERVNYKMKAYNGLKILEQADELRRYAVENDSASIKDKLNSSIPDFLNYTVVIFNETTNLTEKPSLIGDTISVSYFLAGEVDDYKPRDVRVYLWGFD